MTEEKTIIQRLRTRIAGEIDWGLAFLGGRWIKVPNDVALRVFAMRRSGHHAVINWIRYQYPGRHYFLNDCKPGENPFRSAVLSSSLVYGGFGERRIFRPHMERPRRFTKKGVLIYNYEEVDLASVPQLMPEKSETDWVGPSGKRHDVLILRDPFNLLASKLKWARGGVERPSKPTLEDVEKSKDLWKVYAREFLGETSFLKNRVNISYNKWFLDRSYRDEVGAILGFDNRDIGKQEVAKWGPTVTADSFDGLKFEGRAESMKVMERWRAFKEDGFYRRLVFDKELHELSGAIFGEIAGTQELLSK